MTDAMSLGGHDGGETRSPRLRDGALVARLRGRLTPSVLLAAAELLLAIQPLWTLPLRGLIAIAAGLFLLVALLGSPGPEKPPSSRRKLRDRIREWCSRWTSVFAVLASLATIGGFLLKLVRGT